MVWECQACSYIYDSRKTDSSSETLEKPAASSTPPADWVCPVCGVGPEFLEEVSGRKNQEFV